MFELRILNLISNFNYLVDASNIVKASKHNHS